MTALKAPWLAMFHHDTPDGVLERWCVDRGLEIQDSHKGKIKVSGPKKRILNFIRALPDEAVILLANVGPHPNPATVACLPLPRPAAATDGPPKIDTILDLTTQLETLPQFAERARALRERALERHRDGDSVRLKRERDRVRRMMIEAGLQVPGERKEAA